MDPATLESRLDHLAADVRLLVERQARLDELLYELGPVLKDGMRVATERLQGAEEAGYFRAGRAAIGAVDRVVRTHSPAELDALGDDLVRILDTLRALTRPEVLAVAAEAAEVVERRDALPPVGVIGLARAGGDPDVQRGMAVLLEVLKHVGRAAGNVRPPARPAPPAGRDRHPGLQALAPRRNRPPPAAAAPANPERPGPACAVPTSPGPAVTTVDGIAFAADGSLARPEQWTRALGLTLAEQAGVTMTDAHWALVDFARREWQQTAISPNIRRLSTATGTSTRDIYTLFPKAPGRTIARIAGIPKPAGCL